MDRIVRIQGLEKTEEGLEINQNFPEEVYVGAIYDYGESYLVTKKDGEVVLKPCIIDATVDLTPNGPQVQAEFYFNTEERPYGNSPQVTELLDSIAQTGKPKGDLGFNQGYDFHAYFVERDVYLELKESKANYPTRTVRDAVEMSILESKANERNK